MKCLEPACNRGYMSRALKEYFKKVDSLRCMGLWFWKG